MNFCSSWGFGCLHKRSTSTLPRRPRSGPKDDLRKSTFLRPHAQEIIACDLFVAVTATFHLLYVLSSSSIGAVDRAENPAFQFSRGDSGAFFPQLSRHLLPSAPIVRAHNDCCG